MAVHERAGAATLFGVVLAIATLATAQSSGSLDGGLVTDAGNTLASALTLSSFGSYSGRLTGDDTDWYAVREAALAQCVSLETTTVSAAASILALDTGSGLKTTSTYLPAGGKARLVLASPYTGAYAGLDNVQGTQDYGFTLKTVGIPAASVGDALSGLDAGNHLSTALATSAGCIGGRLSSLQAAGDVADVYAVAAAAGDVVTYSLVSGSSGGALRLRLLDAAGNLLGPILAPGGVGAVQVPSSGTYFLSVTQDSFGSDDVGYVMGAGIGPPDPGSSCRPNC